MTYLISIAIGPVQEFISTARRSRDLWFGSRLLSELSKAAANAIHSNGGTLIFPSASSEDLEQNRPFSVVNKLTAKITIEKEAVQKFAEDVEEAAKCRLRNLRNEAFERFKTDEYFDLVSATAQIEDLLEFYCVAVPLPDENAYSIVRRQAESLLTARKNTRNFASAKNWAREGVPKSSLDGLRESVISEAAYKSDGLSAEERRKRYETRPGERLCGVGLLKRIGNWQDAEGFFSTSHVAAFPLLRNLKNENNVAVDEYFTTLESLKIGKGAWSSVSGNGSSPDHLLVADVFQRNDKPCDGRLLFEDRFAEYFNKEDKEKIRRAKKALQKFLEDALGDRKPNPYYALLLADGDGMGDAIKARDTSDKHRELSSKLSAFANGSTDSQGVRVIVETNHHGSLIYAGGDDVLAFVPVHQIVPCAKALSDAFKTALGDGLTLSIGVAICHHLDPLSDALTLAREAEKEAKRFPDKNALCIKLDKRGGETTTVVDHWGKLDERLKFFTLLFAADKLPDGVAYEFQKLAHQLALEPRAIPGEVKRILKRKRAGHGEEAVDKKVILRLEQALDELRATGEKKPLARLAEELIVARALAAAHEQSFPSQEEAKKDAQKRLGQILQDIQVEDGGDNANLAD